MTMEYNEEYGTISFDPEKEKDVYARACQQCNKGMNVGYLLNGDTTLCSQDCAKDYWNDRSIEYNIEDAVRDGNLDFTEWEELDLSDDYTWYPKEGGQEMSKYELVPVLLRKFLQDKSNRETLDIAIDLLKEISRDDKDFNFGLDSVDNEEMDMNDVIYSLKSNPDNEKWVEDIISTQIQVDKPIVATVKDGFNLEDENKPFEVELVDQYGVVKSEFYNAEYKADKRAKWINKDKPTTWEEVVPNEMDKDIYIVCTNEGLQELNVATGKKESDIEKDGADIADEQFGDGNWSFIISEDEAYKQLEKLARINTKYAGIDANREIHSLNGCNDDRELIKEFDEICRTNNTHRIDTYLTKDWENDLKSILKNQKDKVKKSAPSQGM